MFAQLVSLQVMTQMMDLESYGSVNIIKYLERSELPIDQIHILVDPQLFMMVHYLPIKTHTPTMMIMKTSFMYSGHMLRHNTKRARLLWSLNYCGWEQGHGEPGYVHIMCGINEPVLQGVCDLPVNDIH